MEQAPIGERLKILMNALGLKVRPFAQTLGVSETTVRNYTERGSKPSSEFLENIINHFDNTNPVFLLTGKGEPLILPIDENNQAITGSQKFFRSPVVATGQGTAYQENNATLASDVEAIKNKLALAEQEVEHLKAQLSSRDATIAAKDMIIAAKDDMLALLRITYNRPN